MIRNAKTLENAELHARDGTIGKVKDFYFDDQEWRVRYLIIDTGSWLTGRSVLIASSAVSLGETADAVLNVDLTREQVRNSPDVDAAKPVSRQYEEQLHRHYAWPYYWRGPYIGGGVGGVDVPIAAPAAPTAVAVHAARNPSSGRAGEIRDQRGADAAAEAGADPQLRSVHAVRGYHIEAADGAIGHVEDVLLDDANWAVRYLIVDTRNWLPGKKVIIAPRQVRQISWLNSSVFVDLTRDAIKRSPEFDESRGVTADYTDRLEAHYRAGGLG